MPGTEKDTKAGCCGAGCSCKEASVDKGGKKFCSTACADGTHKDSCHCGHPNCKPKK
jgi:hypothetical protein